MKRTLILVLVILAAGASFAQEEQRMAAPLPPGHFPCPYPYSQTFTAPPPSPPTPIVAQFPAALQGAVAGSTWNQTQVDKHFGHTFRFPSQRECCLMSKGTLQVTIKALQGGGPKSASSANDAVHAIANGAVFASQQPWNLSGVTAGTTTTVTFPLAQAQLANGSISFYVQDDSAVVSAKLVVSGCCIRKP